MKRALPSRQTCAPPHQLGNCTFYGRCIWRMKDGLSSSEHSPIKILYCRLSVLPTMTEQGNFWYHFHI